jgi:hypothetical protein
MCPPLSQPPSDDVAWAFGIGSPSDEDQGVHCGPSSTWPLKTSIVNATSIVLSDCGTKVGSRVSMCRAYSLTTPRGPLACISLVSAELNGRNGAEGPLACRASGLHPQQ